MTFRFLPTFQAYLAGFLDADGSIYVQAKPNSTYRYGFQVAPYIVLYQSQKTKPEFEKLCSQINLGHMRERKDGILEYIISRQEELKLFVGLVKPYLVLKQRQIALLEKVFQVKQSVKTGKDFAKLLQLINSFRELNYSKKRKIRRLTP